MSRLLFANPFVKDLIPSKNDFTFGSSQSFKDPVFDGLNVIKGVSLLFPSFSLGVPQGEFEAFNLKYNVEFCDYQNLGVCPKSIVGCSCFT